MKRVLFSIALVSLLLSVGLQAQAKKSTTRIEKQHGPSIFLEKHLKQTEESLLPALRGEFEGSQQMAIQLLRQLEQLFPEYPFAATIPTLGKVLKDEKSDPVARRLAALALDDLHSEAGDTIIKDIASNCDDKGLQTLCNALLVRTDYRLNLTAKN
jgi:hypothetical protein